MAAKLDQSSPARQPKPTMSSPKLSIFGAKPGFVIPKNKLAGSMVIRAKNDTPTTPKEDISKPLQRKTKWGPDLTSDPAVRKAKALAYQTRLEQITKELNSGALETGGNEGPTFTAKGSSSHGADNPKENEQGKVELLELEKQEIIGEILQLNPGYKVPDDYKPILKETKIPLPTIAHPGHDIIGVLIGPERNTQKRLQEETGAKIRVYGTKKANGEKCEVHQPDIHEAQAVYEDLYIHVSADSFDKVDAAVVLIELLLTPVSVNSTADTSETATVSSAVTPGGVNPADVQQVQSTVSQPGLLQYQSDWLTTPQTDVPSILSSGSIPNPLPNNHLQLQPPVGSFIMPPYTGQPPHMNFMSRNQPSLQNIQQPSHPFQANPSIGPPFGRPLGNAYNPQSVPSSAAPLPVRPLQTPHASGGWPTFPPAMAQSQRPLQGAPTFMPMRPPISVSPLGAAPVLQGAVPLVPSQSNMSTSYSTQHPPRANFTPSATLHSRPPGGHQSFPSVSSQGPSSVQVLSSPAGASPQPPYPLSMQMRPPMSTPSQMRGPPSPFPQVGPTPGNAQVAPSSHQPAGMPGLSSGSASTGYSQTSIAALRPPRPATGDFTFRPHAPPSPNLPASANQMGGQANTPFGLPLAPLFRPANQSPILPVQGFQRPLDGNHMGQARMHGPPAHFPGAFPGNPSALQSPAGFRPFTPAVQPSNPSNRMPSRPFHFLPPQQNPFPNANRPGSNSGGPNPIYDPFAPTAVSGAKKADSDPEYEDPIGMK